MIYSLPLILLLLLAGTVAHAATQVGSAPYRASATGAGNSHAPVFSADGKHIAFVSHANNLVTNDDLAPHLDLFVRDLVTSNTVLVSVSTNGFGGGNDNVGLYSMSSNAQVIVFDTTASNLLPWDNNRVSDIYVRDLQFGGTTRVSWGLDGDANGPSYNPHLSEDGQRVIFESLASNLVTNDFNGTNDIFIHDLTTGVTELVSVNAAGTASPDGPSHSPSISADGLTVAFVSHATNLVVVSPIIHDGTNLIPVFSMELDEVYARDIRKGSNIWAMASHLFYTREAGGPPTWNRRYQVSDPQISANGRYVAFKTTVALVRFDLQEPPNNVRLFFPPPSQSYGSNIFLFQDNPRFIKRAKGVASSPLLMTPNGRHLIYTASTNASVPTSVVWVDFGTLLTNNGIYCFDGEASSHLCDGGTGSYTTNVYSPSLLVSTNLIVPHLGDQPRQTGFARGLSVTDDGQRITFVAETEAAPLLGISGKPASVFVRNITNTFAVLLTTNLSGLPGPDLRSTQPGASRDGSLIAWDSPDDALVPDDLNRAWDVFVRNVDTGETQVASAPHPALPPATGAAMASIAGRQSISGNGSRVVVLTRDSSLTPSDTNTLADAVLRDLRAQTNVAVSGPFLARIAPRTSIIRLLGSTNEVFTSAISANGRYVMFGGKPFDAGPFGSRTLLNWTNIYWRDLLLGTNDYLGYSFGAAASDMSLSRDGELVGFSAKFDMVGYELNTPEERVFDGNGGADVFIRNYRLWPWRTLLMSTSTRSQYTNGASLIYAANGPSINPVFSPDSRSVIFQSLATDLTYDFGPVTAYQLYARNIDGNSIKRISYSGSSQTNVYPLAGGATNPVFSADARFVFFEGSTSNLIYRHDLLNDMDDSGTARRPNLVVCSGCANPSASSEGRNVAYESRPATGGATNVFLKDIESGQVELISVALTGTNGNGSSFTPLLSRDARFVVFASKASDLVSGDHNRATDIFVRDRWSGVTHALSRNLAGTGTGNRVSSNPILSADGRTVAFQSFASDLVTGDYNDTRDVFVVTLGGPDRDGDTMEDDWELAYFNTLDRDGSGDFDHDGASDLAEFRAGTNPANDASILRVLRLTTGVAAGLEASRTTVILWSAVPGRTYRVESKASIGDPWTSVGADVVASTVSASATHTLGGDEAAPLHRFYRVLLVQ